MGSGGKFDPLKINISDISETSDCTLARILRKRLLNRKAREEDAKRAKSNCCK